METVLVSLIHEGPVSRVGLVARVRHQPDDLCFRSLRARFEAAAREFLRTPEGRHYLAEIHGDFNWGDTLTEIPNELLRRFGVEEVEMLSSGKGALILDHDEILA